MDKWSFRKKLWLGLALMLSLSTTVGVGCALTMRAASKMMSSLVRALVAEINASGQKELSGIHEVAKAIQQTQSLTQGNATHAEEGAAAAELLNDQSQTLLKIVNSLSTLVYGVA